MSVYLIAQLTIHDRATYAGYVASFVEILARHEGKLLSVDEAPEVIEGEWDCTRTVLLEFPSAERVHAWYDSPEYQAIATYRRKAAMTNLVLIHGR